MVTSRAQSLHSVQAPHLFRQYGVQPPCGVLLWGPPGTGKTSLARAAASDSGAQLFVLNGPDLVSEFYGESEEGLQVCGFFPFRLFKLSL